MKKDVIFILSEDSHGDIGYYTNANKAIVDFLKAVERFGEDGKLSVEYDDNENVIGMNFDDFINLRQEKLNCCDFLS